MINIYYINNKIDLKGFFQFSYFNYLRRNAYAIYFFIVSILISGCSANQNYSEIDRTLALSGSNRVQLEKVLNHYASDSVKLKAAKYLIANMRGHYSYSDTTAANLFYDALDSLLHSMRNRTHDEIQQAIFKLYAHHNVDQFTVIEDARIISADFLIDNIDCAFEQWHSIPWCQNLNFDEFCEYILPYKVAETQELKPWRKEFAILSEDSLKRMSSCSLFRISTFQATEVVNNCIKQYFSRDPIDHEIPLLYYRPMTRLKIPFGTCDELCNAGLNAFRAVGIPVTIDYVPVWGYGNRGHSWGIVKAPNGHDIPFVPIYMSPYTQHKVNETVGKAYRRTFARNPELEELNNGYRYVPSTFQNIFQRDVTTKYAKTRNIIIDVNQKNDEYVYLCTSSRTNWKPVAFAKVANKKAEFKDIGIGCIYLPVKYDLSGNQIPLGEPIIVGRDGSIKNLAPNFNNRIKATLYRKAPLLEYAWNMAVKIENGTFEASNDPDFKTSVIISKINTPADQAGEIILPDSIDAYRFWRFIQRGDSASCYVGEISFYNGVCDITSNGSIIGNFDKSQKDNNLDGSRAFDGNVLTAVSYTKPHEAWIGLDFGKPTKISMIRYSPRSDGNMIEPGDEYELNYWHNNKWNTLDRKIASSVSIEFDNIPSDALYVLLNLTKGNSVRVFLLNKDNIQEWW